MYAQGSITASEVKWLKKNLLSKIEYDRLKVVEATVQTNLLDLDEHKEVKAQTTSEIRRIGWGKKQGLKYIKEQYGLGDRQQMSIEQLIEFRDYLRTFSSKKSRS